MARTHNGLPLDLIWALVDLTHPRAQDVLDAAAVKVATRFPGSILSVNRNIANTRALVKVTGTEAELSLPTPVRAAILRIFTDADHAEALAMVTTEEWAGPPVDP